MAPAANSYLLDGDISAPCSEAAEVVIRLFILDLRRKWSENRWPTTGTHARVGVWPRSPKPPKPSPDRDKLLRTKATKALVVAAKIPSIGFGAVPQRLQERYFWRGAS